MSEKYLYKLALPQTSQWHDAQLPAHDGVGWAVLYKGMLYPCSGIHEVRQHIDKYPMGALVGQPSGDEFVPAIRIPSLQKKVMSYVQRDSTTWILANSLVGLVFLGIGLFFESMQTSFLGITLLALAIILYIDYRRSLSKPYFLEERFLFFMCLRYDRRAKFALKGWVFGVTLAGIIQIALVHILGSNREVFEVMGVIYPLVEAGEWWRFLTGPFLHFSLVHYLTNAVLALLIGTLAFTLTGLKSLFVFLSGNIVAGIAQMMLGGDLFDNFGGISGGLYALFGYVAMLALLEKRLLPHGLALFLAGIAVVSISFSEVASAAAATTAHVAGLLFGISFAVSQVLISRK